MDILHEFSTALLQARQRKNATQEQVAWDINVSQASYNAWECGHRLCPYKHIVSLINYFDDEQFTRRVLRILLMLQHNMAGLDRLPKEDMKHYYRRLLALLSDECNRWLQSL
ncbi:MAG: helix-turn-helix transcriptional regulator [Paludibacteraceae bacterium]|nr:helix-turn-helix transcriptional regulator [Paludibacteraceae bacterium]